MPNNANPDRRLSQFGETWVRETDRVTADPPATVGWCLWAAVTLVMVVVLVLQTSA